MRTIFSKYSHNLYTRYKQWEYAKSTYSRQRRRSGHAPSALQSRRAQPSEAAATRVPVIGRAGLSGVAAVRVRGTVVVSRFTVAGPRVVLGMRLRGVVRLRRIIGRPLVGLLLGALRWVAASPHLVGDLLGDVPRDGSDEESEELTLPGGRDELAHNGTFPCVVRVLDLE